MRYRLATRGSKLALVQADLARAALARRHPQHEFVLEPVETAGDRAPTLRLTEAAQEGVFVKELEQALLDGRAELAVHSAKDLPTAASPGLTIAAFLPRADARDSLIAHDGGTLETLRRGARIGTGSPRRAAQLLARRPDFRPVPIRGNVDTRLRRLAEGRVDALVLAAAGMARLGRLDEVHEFLAFDVMLPAPGQGALALQTREGSEAARLATEVDDAPTRRAVVAERAVLRRLGGGCLSAIGAHGVIEDGVLVLAAVVLTEDGDRVVRAHARGRDDDAVITEVVATLHAQGAAGLLHLAANRPLTGVRVMVTRADAQAGGLTRMLEDLGATVRACPVIEIQPLRVDVSRFAGVDQYDWCLFTSANGVERFFELLGQAGSVMSPRVRVGAIGPETAARLRQHGVEADLVPARFVSEDLADAMPAAMVRGTRILLPRAAGARDVLPDRLRAAGALVDVVETYRAVTPADLATRLPAMLAGVDVVTFTSSSTVRNFAGALNGAAFPSDCLTACIGPITAETARELGLRVDIIAQEYTARGLVEALARHQTSIQA
ncbi:MAG TPA: hydroxymethylbilane synthase [Candidatus Dormibacteraeota bacterium]